MKEGRPIVTTERELAEMIRTFDPGETRIDAQSIQLLASRRERRHRELFAVTAVLVLVAAAIGVLLDQTSRKTVASPTAGPSNHGQTNQILRPACPPPMFSLVGPTPAGPATWSAKTSPLVVAVPSVRLDVSSGPFVLRAMIVVGRPGSNADVGDPSNPPRLAVLRSDNQLVSSSLIDISPSGQLLSVRFVPTRAGDYPVFTVVSYRASEDCLGPAPTIGVTTTAVQRVGVVHVT